MHRGAGTRGGEKGTGGESWGGEVITSSRGSMRREPGVSYFPATFLRNYRAYPVTCVTRLRNYAESGHLISVILQRGLFRRAVINDRAERASNVHLLLLRDTDSALATPLRPAHWRCAGRIFRVKS